MYVAFDVNIELIGRIQFTNLKICQIFQNQNLQFW